MQHAPADPRGRRCLEAQLLGGCAIRYRGVALAESAFKRRRSFTLLLLLLTRPAHRVTREDALQVLWPDKHAAESERGLRVVLSDLRAALGEDTATSSIVGRGALIALHADLEVAVDADRFERAATEALARQDPDALRQAAALYSGDYLPERPYDDWASERREHLSRLHERLLARLARHEQRADPAAAERHLRALLRADATDEGTARQLMALLAEQGRRAEALRVYQSLAATLREELDVAPGKEVEAVRARLFGDDVIGHLGAHAARPQEQSTNLPTTHTSFVGRAWELAEVTGLLAQPPSACRLITLIGPGGCGKTRLALAAAGAILPQFPDGVWFVDLAPLTDQVLVPQVVAAALSQREAAQSQSGQTSAEHVIRLIEHKRLLLVLDNCEHLIDCVAALTTALLHACSQLHVLATSREALAILGEVTWLVPPLGMPPEARQPGDEPPGADPHTLATVISYGAIRLFVERARASTPSFTLTERTAPIVVGICRALDGMPLAIELATAQLRARALDEIAARLDTRLHMLAGGSRGAHHRHRTLQAVMDWSYALLEPTEQVVLQRLAIFAGGWTLEAAEVICADAALPAYTVMRHVVRLVDTSLVGMDQAEGMPARYRMLETVRQYARERLAASGADAVSAIEERHAAWYLALAEQDEPALAGADQVAVLARLEADHDNLRAALRWSVAGAARAEQAGRLVAALWRFWEIRVHWTEAGHWLKQALDLRGGLSTPVRIRVLKAACTFALNVMDHDQAAELLGEVLALQRETGDRAGVATSLHQLALLHHRHGEDAKAITRYQESLALRRALGDSRGMASTLNNLGVIATGSMRYDEAVSLFEESRSLYRVIGDLVNVAYSLNNTGVAVRKQGDLAGATSYYQQGLELFRQLGERWGIAASLNNMGLIARQHGDYATAQAHYRKSMTLWRAMGDKQCVLESLEGWADLAMAQDDPRRGARLFGAVHAARLAMKMPASASDQEAQAPLLAAARAVLGEDAFRAAWGEGEAMSIDEAIRYALTHGPTAPTARTRAAAAMHVR